MSKQISLAFFGFTEARSVDTPDYFFYLSLVSTWGSPFGVSYFFHDLPRVAYKSVAYIKMHVFDMLSPHTQ